MSLCEIDNLWFFHSCKRTICFPKAQNSENTTRFISGLDHYSFFISCFFWVHNYMYFVVLLAKVGSRISKQKMKKTNIKSSSRNSRYHQPLQHPHINSISLPRLHLQRSRRPCFRWATLALFRLWTYKVELTHGSPH